MATPKRASDAYRRATGFVKTTDDRPVSPPSEPRAAAGAGPPPPFAATAPRHADRTAPGGPQGRVRKVAVFLSLIGRAEAAGILKRMGEDEVESILAAMADLGTVSREETRRVLAEFGGAERLAPVEIRPGPETAREILVRAFGVEEGDRRFYQILPDERPRRFSFLEDVAGRQLAALLRRESPATLAILCGSMPKPAAARLLDALAPEARAEVVRRLARLGRVEPQVVEAIEGSLRRRLETLEPDSAQAEVDGQDRLAEILRYMDLASGERIVGELAGADPDLAEAVRRRLTTLDDLVTLDSRDLQRILRQVDDVDLATVIKGRDARFVDALLSGVSERRREMIVLQRESLGPMRRSDIDRTASDLVQLCRRLAEQGEITIRLPGDEFVDGDMV